MGLGGGASAPSSVVKKPWLIQRIDDKDTEQGAVSVDTDRGEQTKTNMAEVDYPQVGACVDVL